MVKNRIVARIQDNLAWGLAQQSATHPPADVEPRPTLDQMTAQVNCLLPLPADEFGRGLYRTLLGRDPSG